MWRQLLVQCLLSVALAANNYGLEGCYESGCMNIKTQEELDAWTNKQNSHMQQFVPAAFQHYASKASDKQYQKNTNLLATGDPPKKQDDPCNGDIGCSGAKSKEELDAWKESQMKHMKNFVPASFQDHVSKGLDDKYKKALNLIENPPTKDEADKSSNGGDDKNVKESLSDSSSANFLAQRDQEAGPASSMLTEVKAGVVFFAWSAGAWVLLVLLYAKLRKGSHLGLINTSTFIARAPEPAAALDSYTAPDAVTAPYTTMES